MNANISDFLNFETNDGDFGNYLHNFSQVLVNDSDQEASPRYTHTFGVRIFLLAGLLVFSVTGNTIALYVLMMGRSSLGKRRARTMFLYITLADVLVTIFPMAGQLVWEILDRKWVAGLVFCKIFKFLQTFSLSSSNYMILALAVERHRAVTRPLSVASSPYRFIISAWLLALVPSAPNLLFFTTKPMDTQVECVNDFDGLKMEGWIKKGYFTLVFLVIFVIPLIVMLLLYSHILLSLKDTAKRMKNAKKQELEFHEQNPNSSAIRASIRVNFPRNGERHFISRAKEKTTNLALTVLTVFMITNLPYMVDEFIRMDKSWCNQSWCGILEAIIGVSIVSNSSINPYIFLLFNSDNSRANSIATRCCLNRAGVLREERSIVRKVSFNQP